MKICIINTGGTISSVGDPLGPMTSAQFATASEAILEPILNAVFPNTEIDYDTTLTFPESASGVLDSTNLQPSDWVLIAQTVLDNYAAYDGFVILHGTDSLAFTGAALPLLLNVFDDQGFGQAVLSKPVIITGSQVPMYYQPSDAVDIDGNLDPTKLILNFNTDAYQNFCGAVACARLGIPEVGVYFDSYLLRGNRVLKINASEFRAFDSPNYPELAEYGLDLTYYPERMLPGPVNSDVSLSTDTVRDQAVTQLNAISGTINNFPAMQFNAFPAPYTVDNEAGTALIGDLIDAAVGTGITGLILESYGEGNFPSGNPDTPASGVIYQALDRANSGNVVIVDCTQVIAGTVNNSAYASGAWLPNVGALNGADMTPMTGLAKAIILQAAASSNGWSADDVKRLIMLNLFGEVMNVSRLDSRENDRLMPGQSIMALDGSATLINDSLYGPLLQTSDGVNLWSPFTSPEDNGQPGRLVMQNDGNLVLYDNDNTAIWTSGTAASKVVGTPSALMISGSYAAGDLTMTIYDYLNKAVLWTLYSQSTA